MTLAEAVGQAEMALQFPDAEVVQSPFVHVVMPNCLVPEAGGALLNWFEGAAPWRLVETDFYEQYEFDLLRSGPPTSPDMFGSRTLSRLRGSMEAIFGRAFQTAIKVIAHKLLPGQHIGIHNDYLPGQETHRLVLQINRGLEEGDGGLFMLFNSPDPSDVYQILRPRHLSGIAFEISPKSFHAVSQMHSGIRYTVVFSFKVAE